MSQRTPVVCVPDRVPPRELVELVRARLARGALVGLPTETVYGLAARADSPAALESLRALKGRPAELAFTWHVGERSAVERFEHLRPLARRLVQRYWPGPLTLLLHGVPAGLEGVARDGWTGVRLPAHAATAGVLAACDFPVVMTSANRHGQPPLTRAEELAARFGEALELVVDGGPSRLGEASAVLRVGPGRFALERDGLLRIEDLRRTAGLMLAFVCTGNTCRSPMAEALCRALLGQRLAAGGPGQPALAEFGFEVLSMGLYAAPGAPASAGARAALAEHGLDLARHEARVATPEVLARCDRIYGLTEAHVEALRSLLPPARASSITLLDPAGADVSDPVGGPSAAYTRARADIERALRARLDEWA